MGLKHPLVGIAIWGLVATGASAQKRPYNLIMKEVASAFDSLRKNLEGGASPAVVADARRLEALFKETGDFWAPFKTRDAIDAARGAREASEAVAAAAAVRDAAKARAGVTAVGRFCTTCHNAHREQMPDKSYRIRP